MSAEFSGQKFGYEVSARTAIFVTVTFGIPLVLYGLDRNAGENVSLTEAIRITTATFVGFAVYVIFAMSMIRPSWRRMKQLGLPRSSSLLVPCLILLDLPYFMAARDDGAFGRSFSTIGGQIPFYLLTATGVVVAIIFAYPLPVDENYSRRFGLAGKGAMLLAVLILAGSVLNVGMAKWTHVATAHLGPEDAPSDLFMTMIKSSIWAWTLNPYICLAFLALVVWCVVLSRRPKLSNGSDTWPTGMPSNI